MTGHGGDEFLKFQDAEEISAFDIADAFEQMWEKRRYHEILFMIDTCQANTMYSKLYSPNILASGSSELDESSYSVYPSYSLLTFKHHADTDIGVAVIDRYTYYNLEFLERNVDITSQHTMKDLFDSYDRSLIHSTPGVRTDLFRRRIEEVKITDFFGNVQSVEIGGGEIIDEDLLDQQQPVTSKSLRENNTMIVRKKDIPEVGEHGFEVKLQHGNVWIKGGAIMACIIMWVTAKRLS
jgi:glycosylphosphatidylinositol transamidase (GPIT) subunit GPI8